MLVIPKHWLKRWEHTDIFTQIFSLPGVIYRLQRGRKTFRYDEDSRSYFIKTHSGYGWLAILKAIAQRRKPVLGSRNEYDAISALSGLGITPTIIGYGWRGLNPMTQQSFIITAELSNTIDLEKFCSDWTKNKPLFSLKAGIIRTVADAIRNMHTRGVNHRDLYLMHFLLDISGGIEHLNPNNLHIYLIDFHISQVHKKVPQRWRVKDIGILYSSAIDKGITQRDLFRFMTYYSQHSLRYILKHEKTFWQRITKHAKSRYKKDNGYFPKIPITAKLSADLT